MEKIIKAFDFNGTIHLDKDEELFRLKSMEHKHILLNLINDKMLGFAFEIDYSKETNNKNYYVYVSLLDSTIVSQVSENVSYDIYLNPTKKIGSIVLQKVVKAI